MRAGSTVFSCPESVEFLIYQYSRDIGSEKARECAADKSFYAKRRDLASPFGDHCSDPAQKYRDRTEVRKSAEGVNRDDCAAFGKLNRAGIHFCKGIVRYELVENSFLAEQCADL